MSLTLTVRGSAQEEIAPERAELAVTIRAESGSKAEAVEAVRNAAAALTAELEAACPGGDPSAEDASGDTASGIERWSVQSLSVSSWSPHHDSEDVLPARFTVDMPARIVFGDRATLSAWVTALAARENIQIGHVSWHLTRGTREAAEVRILEAAVTDAHRRAGALARATGATSLRPVTIRHPVPHSGGPSPFRAALAADDSGDSEAMDPDAFELHPQKIAVSTEIEAVFEAE